MTNNQTPPPQQTPQSPPTLALHAVPSGRVEHPGCLADGEYWACEFPERPFGGFTAVWDQCPACLLAAHAAWKNGALSVEMKSATSGETTGFASFGAVIVAALEKLSS